jgi:NDMA-dependent alcohol dehydrogenase
MKSRAAVLHGVGQEWEIEEIEVEPPRAGEVLVEWKAAGLCHSDEHFVSGDIVMPGGPSPFPIVGGHEGAGVVAEVGPGVTSVAIGDHISGAFVAACGSCDYCTTGRSYICDAGRSTFEREMITDGTNRHFLDGEGLLLMAKLGTYAERTVVAERSVVKVDDDLPLRAVALVSCGVTTGWGSAVYRGGTQPGDTVVVIGVGGIGMNAVQGARIAGARRIIAVDPGDYKLEQASAFGATQTFSSVAEAIPAVQDLTLGRMAHRVIVSPGVVSGDMLVDALTLLGKGGTCVITGLAPIAQRDVSLNLFELAMWNKEIKGTIFGSANPRFDVPKLLDMYRAGTLKLDELITKTYRLEAINDGFEDMRQGRNIRGVVIFD